MFAYNIPEGGLLATSWCRFERGIAAEEILKLGKSSSKLLATGQKNCC